MSIPASLLRQSIGVSTAFARVWFEEQTSQITRKQFQRRSGLKDDGRGSVYVYFKSKGKAVYVGQTSRTVKSRLHDQTSPHKNASWWKKWTHVRFIQLPKEMDRFVLELLLILAYAPEENRKPCAVSVHSLFNKIRG